MDELKAIQQFLIEANKARREGASEEQIDTALRNASGFGFNELVELARQLGQEGPETQLTTRNLLEAGVQGALFNFGDEAAGIGAALVPGGRGFTEARNAFDERTTRFRQDHPGAAFAAGLIGGLAVPGIGIGGNVAKAVRGAGLLAPALTGGVLGIVGAAVDKAGREPEDFFSKETLAEVGVGGVLGAGLGALAGPVASVAGAALGRTGKALAPVSAGIRAGRRAVRDAAERAGLSADAITSRLGNMERLKPGLPVLADVTEQFRRLTRTQLNEASGELDDIIQRVRARSAGQSARLSDDLRDLSGFTTRTAQEAEEAVNKRLSEIGDELFAPVRGDVLDDPRLTEILSQPDVAEIANKVKRGDRANLQFRNVEDLPLTVDGARRFRRNVRDRANTLFRKGQKGEAIDLRRTLDDFDTVLEDIVPEFRAVNRQYATTAEVARSFGEGARATKGRLNGTQVAAKLDALGSDEAREAFRHGLVDQRLLDLANLPTNRNVARTFVNMGEGQRGALRAAFKTEDAFKEFLDRALIEDKFTALKDAAIGNSTTAAQTGDLLRSVRNARGLGASILRQLTTSPAEARARSNEIARLLLSPVEDIADELPGVLARSAGQRVGDALLAGGQAGALLTGARAGGLLSGLAVPADATEARQ